VRKSSTVKLAVKVVPGSSREGIAGWLGEELKVRVRQVPEAGKANKALIQLLARALDLPADCIQIVSGSSSAHKIIAINGLDEQAVRRRLLA